MRRGPVDSVSVLWLTNRGVWKPELSHAENMDRCARFREKCGRVGAPAGKEWAHALLARYQAGEPVPVYSVRLAMSALELVDMPVLHNPKTPPPRPDAKERQANDVEVEF